jgi:hypothetical protein
VKLNEDLIIADANIVLLKSEKKEFESKVIKNERKIKDIKWNIALNLQGMIDNFENIENDKPFSNEDIDEEINTSDKKSYKCSYKNCDGRGNTRTRFETHTR